MINPGFYMHQNSKDVCIEIVKIQWRGPKKVKFKFYFWNLGYTGNPWKLLPDVQKMEIEYKDLKYWHRLTDEQLSIPRTSPGLPKVLT